MRPRRCLVLNADYLPLSTYPLSVVAVEDAICAVIKDKVSVVEEWPEVFRSPSTSIQLPKVVALRDYVSITASPKFCRRSILLRDHYSCQYCGHRFPSDQLTFDHVIPRAAGGKTEWTNILSCCVDCNVRKRDQLPNFSGKKGSGLRPLKTPRQPTAHELLQAGLDFLSDTDRETWGEFLYWNAELEP